MTFTTRSSKDVRTIRQGEKGFMISDGMIQYPRAMIHVLPDCPANVRHLLEWAISEGYIKSVAHVYGKELTMEALR